MPSSEDQQFIRRPFRLTMFGCYSALLLLLSACVSVPEQAQLISRNPEPGSATDCAAPKFPAHKLSGLPPDGFSLTSWNIYKQQKTGWATDLELLNANTDILLLQEAYLDQGLLKWLDQHVEYWEMNPAFEYRSVYAGVMTAGRIQSSSQCSLRIEEPVTGIPKTALLSYYPIRDHDQQLLVVNIHGVNFTLDSAHLEQQLTEISKVIGSHQGPAILAGDFNTWNRPRTLLLESLARKLNMASVVFEGQQPSMRLGYKIDHVYYRGLQPTLRQVKAVDSSDHFPMKVSFKIKK